MIYMKNSIPIYNDLRIQKQFISSDIVDFSKKV